MLKLIVTNKLSEKILDSGEKYSFISFRNLSDNEIGTARKYNVQRYFLTGLSSETAKDFFFELEKFWNSLIKPFDRQHPFWRNVFSTKMQEWEKSPIYLILVLYSLLKSPRQQKTGPIIIICNSIEESIACIQWGRMNGWEISDRYFKHYPEFIVRIIQEFENLFSFILIAAKLIVKKIYSPKIEFNGTIKNRKILISTLFYDSCFVNKRYRDHFFGKLEEVFKKNSYEIDYLACPLGNYFKTVNLAKKKEHFFIPYSFVSWFDLLKIFASLLMSETKIKKAIFSRYDFSAIVRWSMRRNNSFFNCDAEVYYLAVKRLCKNKNYDRLIQLYEGNIIEKASIQAFREFSQGKVIGYGHAVIYPLNLKIYRTSLENICSPSPDFLISSGVETKKMLSCSGNYKNIPIYPGCSLREFSHIKLKDPGEDHGNNTILIALDGTWSCVILLDWILLNFKQLKGRYEMILRGHPNVPVMDLLSQCINPLPEHFFISSSDLGYDMSVCFCVIYRQSSVGLQALMNGIPAIQLNIDLPLNGDPIGNFHNCKWVVDNMDDLNTTLNEIKNIKTTEKRSGMIEAKKYSAKYFTPPDQETVKPFLR